METIRELTTSLRSYVRERLTNPVYGAFLVAWAVLNFRLILVLAGSGTWREKITYIDTRLYPEGMHWAWYGFAYPFLVGVAFVMASPYLSRWATLFLRKRERDTLVRLLEIEGETPLTKEQANVLRQSVLSERKRRLEERDVANRQIDELQRQLDTAALERPETAAQVDTPPLASLDLEPKPEVDHLVLHEDDFVGVPQQVYVIAAMRGLTTDQASMLYALRNEELLSLDVLRKRLHLPEHHTAKVLADQLRGLRFIMEDSDRGVRGFRITSAGSQALAAVMKRGFKPVISAA